MPYKKKDLLHHLRDSKKALRVLNKLYRYDGWGTRLFALWEVIEETEQDIALYKKKLKNKEYEK